MYILSIIQHPIGGGGLTVRTHVFTTIKRAKNAFNKYFKGKKLKILLGWTKSNVLVANYRNNRILTQILEIKNVNKGIK